MPLGPLKDDLSLRARIIGWARTILLTTAGFTSILGINLLQIMSLVLLPFSPQSFRSFNRWCADSWWGWCVIVAERFNRTRIVITGQEVPAAENAVVISNHQQMPDITVIMAFARSKRRLGDLKFFVKKAIKWVPGVGWGMQFIDCPFVNRSWTADRDSIRRTFAKIVRHEIPLWLVSFVEGTRVTPPKLRRSQEYAQSRGLRLTRHVLLPRTKGFAASVSGLRNHVSAVYDLTIGYVEGVPTLWQYIRGSVRRIHLHVRRFPISESLESEAELSEWLIQRFYEKDTFLEHFYAHGLFPEEKLSVEQLPAVANQF